MLPIQQILLAGGGVAPDAELTYQGAYGDESNLATYTYSGVTIGSAATDRFVIIGACDAESTGASTITGVTFNGNAATLLGTITTNNGENTVAFYGLLVPTGTTVDVVVTYGASRGNAGIGVWTANKLLSTTPTSVQTNAPSGSVNNAPVTITVPSGGFIIALTTGYTAGALTCSWAGTGITEDFDGAPGTNNGQQSGASGEYPSGASVTITPTWSSTPTAGRVATVAIAMR